MATIAINQEPITSSPVLLKKADRPAVLKIAGEYLSSPGGIRELVVEPTVVSLKWAELAVTALTEIIKGPQEIFERAGHLLLWAEFPTQVKKIYKSIVKLKDSLASRSVLQISDKTAKVFIHTAVVGGLIGEGLEILHDVKLIALSSLSIAVLSAISFVGMFALLVSAIRGIKKQVYKLINSELGSPQFKLALFKLICKVCLAVVSILSMAAFFYTASQLMWVILAFSTLMLLFTLITYFYEKTHFAEKVKPSSIQASMATT